MKQPFSNSRPLDRCWHRGIGVVINQRKDLIRTCVLGVIAAAAISSSSAAEKVVIGLSQPNLGWPYIAAYTKAFQEAAAKKGNVEVIALSGEGDIAKQSRDMDSLIAK